MNGIHDMGGMHGFGPVERESDEPVFHHAWEGRVFGMFLSTQVSVPEGRRYKIETMDPGQYLSSSYYERWMQACIQACIDAGLLTADELNARMASLRDTPSASIPEAQDPERLEAWQTRVHNPRTIRRDSNREPRFTVGDAVRVRNLHPVGHTRLPRYARGKPGVVVRFYGCHDVQDHLPPGTDAPPEPVYAVRFEAQTLWGNEADPHGALYLDMWERYLEPQETHDV